MQPFPLILFHNWEEEEEEGRRRKRGEEKRRRKGGEGGGGGEEKEKRGGRRRRRRRRRRRWKKKRKRKEKDRQVRGGTRMQGSRATIPYSCQRVGKVVSSPGLLGTRLTVRLKLCQEPD